MHPCNGKVTGEATTDGHTRAPGSTVSVLMCRLMEQSYVYNDDGMTLVLRWMSGYMSSRQPLVMSGKYCYPVQGGRHLLLASSGARVPFLQLALRRTGHKPLSGAQQRLPYAVLLCHQGAIKVEGRTCGTQALPRSSQVVDMDITCSSCGHRSRGRLSVAQTLWWEAVGLEDTQPWDIKWALTGI